MDEIQEWYCEVCKKYSLKRKDKHLLTRIHEINQARLDRKEAYEDYMMRRYYILMENTGLRPFSKYLEISALVYRIIKKDFELFYKDEHKYIHYDTDSDSDSDSDSDTDSDSDSDDEDTDYEDEIHKNNQARLDRKNAYEDYVKRRYDVLMENENDEYMGLSKRLKKSARVYRLIKKEFNRNYKVTD